MNNNNQDQDNSRKEKDALNKGANDQRKEHQDKPEKSGGNNQGMPPDINGNAKKEVK